MRAELDVERAVVLIGRLDAQLDAQRLDDHVVVRAVRQRDLDAALEPVGDVGVHLELLDRCGVVQRQDEGLGVALFERHYGAKHLLTGVGLFNVGQVYFERGELALARQYYADARTRLQAAAGPEHAYTAYAIAGFGELALHLNYNYSESAHAIAIKSNGTAPNSAMSSRGVFDGRLSLRDIEVGSGGRLELALWGMNLTDEEYIDNIIDFTSYRAGTLGWPRTYGLEVTLDL